MTEPATSTTERMHPRVCSRTAHPSDKNHWRWPWRKNFGQNDWWFRHQKPKKGAGHMASSHQEWATETNKTDVQILISVLMNVVKCKTDSPKSSETQMAVWTSHYIPSIEQYSDLAQLKSLETQRAMDWAPSKNSAFSHQQGGKQSTIMGFTLGINLSHQTTFRRSNSLGHESDERPLPFFSNYNNYLRKRLCALFQ